MDEEMPEEEGENIAKESESDPSQMLELSTTDSTAHIRIFRHQKSCLTSVNR